MHASTIKGKWPIATTVVVVVLGLHGAALVSIAKLGVTPEKRDARPVEVTLVQPLTPPMQIPKATPPAPLPIAPASPPKTDANTAERSNAIQAPPPQTPAAQALRPTAPPSSPARRSEPPTPVTPRSEPVPPITTPSVSVALDPELKLAVDSTDRARSQEARPERRPSPTNDEAESSKHSNSAPNTDQAPASTVAALNSGARADATWSGNQPPPYPPSARRLREEGDVRLAVHIDERGLVTEVRVVRSSGSPRLDSAAIETVKKWRFVPATVNGQPVASWYDDWLWTFRIDH